MQSVRKKVLGVEIEAHPVVFPVSALMVVGFVIAVAIVPRRAMIFFDWLQEWIAQTFGWLYLVSMTGFLIFALYLCFSRFGKIRLGPDDALPEFPTITWFAMLFSAGMGIGMLFFGVAEPMWHYMSPPTMPGQTLQSARGAMGITLFHWCLHPWALYALVGISLAYFGFRKGLPLTFRSAFYPLLGDRIYGRIGDAIDVLAVLATLFGLATSLGLGAKQVNAGLAYVFGISQSTNTQIIIIASITTLAVASLVSGLHVGVRRLSELNMVLAGALLLFLFVAGPTVYLLGSVVDNTGSYLRRLPYSSFWTGTYDGEAATIWLADWTIFYWGWWIAWSPFVGTFIARVSRGRTIREFITGVLLIPSAVSIVWMTGFGSSAMHQELYHQIDPSLPAVTATYDYSPRRYPVQTVDEASGLAKSEAGDWLIGPGATSVSNPTKILLRNSAAGLVTKRGTSVEYQRGVLVYANTLNPYRPIADEIYRGRLQSTIEELTIGQFLSRPVLAEAEDRKLDTTATAMFVLLEAYPFAWLTALVGTLCVILFFVTSSDSASLVADIIASGGSHSPTVGTRLFWGILEGVLASVLLLAGGLKALQTGAISIGLPFCFLVILMCVSLLIALRAESSTGEPSGD